MTHDHEEEDATANHTQLLIIQYIKEVRYQLLLFIENESRCSRIHTKSTTTIAKHQ